MDNAKRRIYWLNRLKIQRPDGTTEELRPMPEVIAVAIAKCSRTDTPFDQNVCDVSLEKAAEFHEKWVVGFGHGSVAEHAVSSVAVENISQVVIKIIENARLASFTEKSSRYQVFSRERSYSPPAIATSPLGAEYNRLIEGLYGLYEALRPPIGTLMRERFPQAPDQPDKAYEAQTKARTLDVVRTLLPAAALGSLGITANAREWENIISKLLSSPLEEARAVGQEIKNVLKGEPEMDPDMALSERPHPTLLKYADTKPYLAETPVDLRHLARQTLSHRSLLTDRINPVVMVRDDEFAEARVAAALLMSVCDQPYDSVFQAVRRDRALAERVMDAALAKRPPHMAPLREFEHAQFQHEIVMDYGAWRDIQRHRICTQTNQPLGVNLGYQVPEEVVTVGQAMAYEDLMQEAAELYAKLLAAGLVNEAEYAVPMAFRRRLLVSWNLRELFHFIELRSGIKGHPSYRRIAQELWRTIDQTHPFLAKYIRVDLRGNEATASTVGFKPKGI